MEIKTRNGGLIPHVLHMLLVAMYFMVGTTSRIKHTDKKDLKKAEKKEDWELSKKLLERW